MPGTSPVTSAMGGDYGSRVGSQALLCGLDFYPTALVWTISELLAYDRIGEIALFCASLFGEILNPDHGRAHSAHHVYQPYEL